MPGWERIQAAKHCLVLAEKLAAAGKKAESAKVYTYLVDSRKDASEAYIREAAQNALHQRANATVTAETSFADATVDQCQPNAGRAPT